MKLRLRMVLTRAPGRARIRVFGTPLGAVLLALVAAWAVLAVRMSVVLVRDCYLPYEGRVRRIETRWHDRVPFEFEEWEHLIIETPGGGTIDRMVGTMTRLNQRIAAGDYVVKGRGFGARVRPRDKRTVGEILREWDARGGARGGP